MNIHCLQHVSFESPGAIATWALARGHELTVTRLFEGQPLPDASAFDALVVMGGPMSIHDDGEHPWLRSEKHLVLAALEGDRHVFGVCLGAQLIAHVAGSRVYRNRFQEIGWFPVEATAAGVKKLGLPPTFPSFHWHGDTFQLPPGAVHLARTDACEQQMFSIGERVIGIQFHLEVGRDDIAAMLAHGGKDLPEGPYVQQPDDMMSTAAASVEPSHRLLEALLDRWMGAVPQ